MSRGSGKVGYRDLTFELFASISLGLWKTRNVKNLVSAGSINDDAMNVDSCMTVSNNATEDKLAYRGTALLGITQPYS
jgi:hypothetical protein